MVKKRKKVKKRKLKSYLKNETKSSNFKFEINVFLLCFDVFFK